MFGLHVSAVDIQIDHETTVCFFSVVRIMQQRHHVRLVIQSCEQVQVEKFFSVLPLIELLR